MQHIKKPRRGKHPVRCGPLTPWPPGSPPNIADGRWQLWLEDENGSHSLDDITAVCVHRRSCNIGKGLETVLDEEFLPLPSARCGARCSARSEGPPASSWSVTVYIAGWTVKKNSCGSRRAAGWKCRPRASPIPPKAAGVSESLREAHCCEKCRALSRFTREGRRTRGAFSEISDNP